MYRVLLKSLMFVCSITLVVALTCSGQDKKESYVLISDIGYATGDTLKADIYLPVNYKQQKNPVLIFMNGSGSDTRKWDHYTGWAKFAASEGFVSIIYASRENSIKKNFETVLNFLFSQNHEYLIDVSKISVYAGSGNVQQALPLANGDTRINAAIIFYGTAKVENFRLDMPVLLVRAGLDNVQLNKSLDSFAFKALMANAPYTIINFNTALHAFEDFSDNEISIPFLKGSLDFLKRSMQDETQKNFSSHKDEVVATRELYRSNWKAASDAYKQVLIKTPGNNEAERQLGNTCIEMNEYKKALNYYDNALIHGNWRKGEIALKKLYAYAKLNNVEAAISEMRLLKKIGWFDEKEYAGKEEYTSILQSTSYKKFTSEK